MSRSSPGVSEWFECARGYLYHIQVTNEIMYVDR